jgi:hypothetical protein
MKYIYLESISTDTIKESEKTTLGLGENICKSYVLIQEYIKILATQQQKTIFKMGTVSE